MSTLWLPPPPALLPARDYRMAGTRLPAPMFESSPTSVASVALAPFAPAASPAPYTAPSARFALGRANGKRAFACPHAGCEQTFTVNGNLKKHIAARHELRKDFKCTHRGCGRSFAKKFNMVRHLNVHKSRAAERRAAAASAAAARAAASGWQNPAWSREEISVASFMARHCAGVPSAGRA